MAQIQTGLKVAKFLIVQSNTYNDQMARPFTTNVDQMMVNQFKEASHGGNYTAGALAGVAGAIIRPQAESSTNIAIPNGWDQRRFRFNMEVELMSQFGASIRQVLTGYTDYPGATNDGQGMDPNMRVYFNNSITLQSSVQMSQFGNVETMRVADASHVLFPNAGRRFSGSEVNMQSMRPEDVMAAISTQALADPNVVDFRTSMGTSDIKKSRRGNALPAEYMAKTITAIDQAHRLSESVSDHVSVYENARNDVRESLVSQDVFLAVLNQHTQYRYNGFVTYGELCTLFPEIESVRTMLMPGKTQQAAMVPGRGGSEFWHVPTNETVIATILSHSIPAIMMDCMLTKIVFLATNQTLNGQPDVQIRDAGSFTTGVDMGPYLERFQRRLVTEVLSDITRNNMFGINIAMTCNILGDTMVQVALNGGHAVDYVTPSFCDSLTAPIITSDPLGLTTIAHDVELLYSNLTGGAPMNQYSPQAGHPFNDISGRFGGHASAQTPAAPIQPNNTMLVGI